MWGVYAVGSAFFAALTDIFAKMGAGSVDSNLGAAAIRTSFILVLVWGIVFCTGAARGIKSLGPHAAFSAVFGLARRPFLAVLFQGAATRRRFQGRARGQAQCFVGHLFLHEPVSLKVSGLPIMAGSLVLLGSRFGFVGGGCGNGSGTCRKRCFAFM